MSEPTQRTEPCVCLNKDGKLTTDHEDELIVVADIKDIQRRCTVCNRRFVMQHIPGDFTLTGSDKAASAGSRGKTALIAAPPPIQLDGVWDKGAPEPAYAYWTSAASVQDLSRLMILLSDRDPAFGLTNVHIRQKLPLGERVEIEFCSSLEVERLRDLLEELFGIEHVVTEHLEGASGYSFKRG